MTDADVTSATKKVDILDKIYVGRHPEFEGGETGDITGIVNILFHFLLFQPLRIFESVLKY